MTNAPLSASLPAQRVKSCCDVLLRDECQRATQKNGRSCDYDDTKKECAVSGPIKWKALFTDPTYIPGVYGGAFSKKN